VNIHTNKRKRKPISKRQKQMKKITKQQAIEKAKTYGIDFSKDVFEISISDKSYMSELAKEAGYKASKTSCLSTGSAFFEHLKKHL
jgi:arginine utilization protein RocB